MSKLKWVLEASVYSSLRRAHRNSPEYRETLKQAKSEYFILSKKGKKLRRVHFECRSCKSKGSRKQVYVDHINPVISIEGRKSWDEYINRLFCGEIGLQILDKPCHNAKTKQENSLRRQYKKERKDGR